MCGRKADLLLSQDDFDRRIASDQCQACLKAQRSIPRAARMALGLRT
jgi:hypothetical protein